MRNKTTRVSTLITSIVVLEVLAGAITSPPPQKEEKVSKLKRKRLKLPLLVDAIILYIKKAKNSTKKLLDLINEFTKIADKINIQNPTVFVYTNNKFSEIITKMSKNKLLRNKINQGCERSLL